jgi:hypothetical protein
MTFVDRGKNVLGRRWVEIVEFGDANRLLRRFDDLGGIGVVASEEGNMLERDGVVVSPVSLVVAVVVEVVTVEVVVDVLSGRMEQVLFASVVGVR